MYLDEMGSKLSSKSADFEVGGVGVSWNDIDELSFVGIGRERRSGFGRLALWTWL
jgi:hypothetical protein